MAGQGGLRRQWQAHLGPVLRWPRQEGYISILIFLYHPLGPGTFLLILAHFQQEYALGHTPCHLTLTSVSSSMSLTMIEFVFL